MKIDAHAVDLPPNFRRYFDVDVDDWGLVGKKNLGGQEAANLRARNFFATNLSAASPYIASNPSTTQCDAIATLEEQLLPWLYGQVYEG